VLVEDPVVPAREPMPGDPPPGASARTAGSCEVRHRLDEYSDGAPRWIVAVKDGVVTVLGEFEDETEQSIVTVLARTVPGVAAVRTGSPTAS
jgi:hypothetical protein